MWETRSVQISVQLPHDIAEQAEEVHAELRKLLEDRYNTEVAESVRILYGGSVKPGNVVGLMSQPDLDGALVGEFRDRGESIDLVMKLRETDTDGIERIENVPIIAPSGQTIPLSSAVSIAYTTSPTAIRHVEERPAVVLNVAPPEGAALEEAMTTIEEEIMAPLRARPVRRAAVERCRGRPPPSCQIPPRGDG